jgi:hypothetical protein
MPKFLEKYPNLQQIKKAKIEDIQTTISDVINSKKKQIGSIALDKI